MRKIFIITHGNMASGIKDAIVLLTGRCDILAYDCYHKDILNTDELNKKIDEIEEKYKEEDKIIFTDLYGGSVNNELIKRIVKCKNLYIVSGVNLPLMLNFLFTDGKDVHKDIQNSIDAGKEGIINVSKLLLEKIGEWNV